MEQTKRQEFADQIAQESGFEFATYVGKQEDKHVFLAGNKEATPTGLPLFITFDEKDQADSVFSFDYMDLVKEKEAE